jgi:hypothetical protein
MFGTMIQPLGAALLDARHHLLFGGSSLPRLSLISTLEQTDSL